MILRDHAARMKAQKLKTPGVLSRYETIQISSSIRLEEIWIVFFNAHRTHLKKLDLFRERLAEIRKGAI